MKKKTSKAQKRLNKMRNQSCGEHAFVPMDHTAAIPSRQKSAGDVEDQYGIKISEALRIVCEPTLEMVGNDLELVRGVFSVGVLAWNLAVMAPKIGPDKLTEIVMLVENKVKGIGTAGFSLALMDMMERKQKLFREIDAIIVHFEVFENENEYRIRTACVQNSPSVQARTLGAILQWAGVSSK